jgi:hypothetical protein
MTAATWWVAGLAAVVVLVPCLATLLRRCWAGLVGRRRARLRAEALLWAWLSPAQRQQYRARRWFEVTTTSGRRYRILRGGVVRLDPRGSGYCIEATSPVPVADEMLANKLLLETESAASWPPPTASPTTEQAVRHKARAAWARAWSGANAHQLWREDPVGLTLLTMPLVRGDRSTPPGGHWPVHSGWSAAGGPPAPAPPGHFAAADR